MTSAMLVLVVLLLQGAPDDRLKSLAKEAGPGFTCQRVIPNLYLATNLADADDVQLRSSFQELSTAIGDQAFPPSLRAPLTVIAFRDAESLAAYAGRHPEERLHAPGSYDPLHRRLLGIAPLVSSYVPLMLSGLLIKDFVRSETPPAWLVSGLSLLAESSKGPATDSRIALIKNEWLREPSPTLAGLVRMNLDAFQAEDRQSLHLSLSREWLRYLSKRGLLKSFMTECRKSLQSDPTGVKALEAVLATTVEKIEGDWEAHLRSLSWIDPERFGKKARELFGDRAAVQFDDELILAVAGNADETTVSACLAEARKVRRPLLKALGMKASYLPVSGYFFKDQSSFQAHVRATSPDRKEVSLGGLYMRQQRTLLFVVTSGPEALVHELSHSLIIDEVGDLPPWLEEGLASLYEVSELVPGGIRALPGRTLSVVADAQKAGKIPRFEDFLNPRWEGFWEKDRIHLSYSMSRSFMLYLQETGHLAEFFKNLKMLVRTAPQLDPSCSRTLQKSAGMKLEDLDQSFQAWVSDSTRKP